MLRAGVGEAEAVAVEDVEGVDVELDAAVVLDELLTAAPATAPAPAPIAAACMVLVALDLAVCVPRSRIMAEPAGAPVVLAVGATRVERWVTAVAGATGVALGDAAAVAGVGLEPKEPKPLGLTGVVSAGLTFTAVLAGVGAGAAAVLDLLLAEPNEPKPDEGLLGAGAL